MLKHRTLTDSVAGELRHRIVNGTYRPGERINQVALAEELNISRGPLREALRMLQNEGLIKHETNKGTYVCTLSDQDAWEVYTMRALLESEAAGLALERLTPQHFAKLELILRGFELAHLDQNLEQLAACDMEFHRVIVDACGHGRLSQMHGQLDVQVGAMLVTMASKVPVRIGKVVQIHQVLLDALRSGEQKIVKKAFSDHYLDALADLEGRQQEG